MIVVEYAWRHSTPAPYWLLAKDGSFLRQRRGDRKLLDLSGTKEGGYGGSGRKFSPEFVMSIVITIVLPYLTVWVIGMSSPLAALQPMRTPGELRRTAAQNSIILQRPLEPDVVPPYWVSLVQNRNRRCVTIRRGYNSL